MASNDTPNAAFDALRLQAVQDPRAARETFAALVRQGGAHLERILDRIAAPGEGRLRQLVANFARTSPDRKRLAKHLELWLTTETDQFARHAIEIALVGAPTKAKRGSQKVGLVARDLVEMYRYVSERLRHELQNALLGPKTRLLLLLQTIARLDEGVTKAELASLIAQLQDEFTALGRFAEFEPNDPYFTLRPVSLAEWLPRMNAEYAARYSPIDLQVDGDADALSTCVLGSDYLLRLVFWNLWVNAHQAVGNPCSIVLQCKMQGDMLSVVVSDNGRGFPAEMVGVAFEYRFSQRGPNRGRGLLEVQDAIQQLGGDAQLLEVAAGEHRVHLTFSTKTT